MSSIHKIDLPKRIVIGDGALNEIPLILKFAKNNVSKVAMVTGEHTYSVGGFIVEKMVKDQADVVVVKVQDAHVNTAERILDKLRNESVDAIFGVGGGKSIDIAKYVSSKLKVPMISVPLAPSHDGIASPFASLKGTSRPYSVYTEVPYAIVADTSILARAPRRLILSGMGDLLGKLVSVKDWRLAHRLRGEYYGEYAAQLALMSAKHVIKYHELIASGSVEGVRILVEALISSGVSMCIAGSSRPASGSEHLFAHAIELLAPGRVLHGEAVALGTVVMLYIYGDKRWRSVKEIMRKTGLPTSTYELNIEPEVLVKALTIAHTIRPERYTILGERGLSEEAALKVLKETGIV
ncbi:MAG: NAD(P)-dependent glycerol-1-phosphate dehydrogenase [Desulfurococcaceae archaeon]